MAARSLIVLLALTASCALAQQYSTNYVDGGDYDYQDQAQAAPAPRAGPISPQRSIRPAPQHQQQLRPTGPTTPRPAPVAILKQINRHNDDGSYTYGFEGGDGSFKIETKLATGEVMGKYGYVDDTGKVRTVEYGANKYGFQPVGEGITVAPPTLVDETLRAKGDRAPDYDDGQYYEDLPSGPAAQPSRPRAQPQRPRPAAPRPKAQPQQYFESSFQQQQPQGEVIYQQQQQHQHSPVPRVSQNLGPEPPRLQISGAAPAPNTDTIFRSQAPPPSQRQFAAPPPHRPLSHFPQQQQQQQQRSFGPPPPRQFPTQPAPVHQFESSAPRQQAFQPQPQRPAQRQAGGPGGFFDQLTKDYALPSGGHSTPTHDITFGLY